jgi:hypothetical protein
MNYLIQGLAHGSMYALIALGYTMVYGVLQLINFACQGNCERPSSWQEAPRQLVVGENTY